MTTHKSGSCLCGAVTYQTEKNFSPVCFCHCKECQRNYGIYGAFTAVEQDALTIDDRGGHLKWYKSSEHIRRGFCTICGSSVFWQDMRSRNILILTGTLDDTERLDADCHIFIDAKAHYYAIDNELPKYQGNPWDDPMHPPQEQDLIKARIE